MDHGSVLVKFQAEGKIFEITRTIHSNSDRSEQFLITEWLGFSDVINKNNYNSNWKKPLGFRNI